MASANSELLALFREEAEEYLDGLTQGILGLEVSTDDDARATLLREVSRVAHSLKGAARTVNMRGIESVAHHIETAFDAAIQCKLTLSADSADVLYDGLDIIRALLGGTTPVDLQANIDSIGARLEALGRAAPAGEAAWATEPPPVTASLGSTKLLVNDAPPQVEQQAESATIRVSIGKLDALMAQVSELLVSNINLEQRLAEFQAFREQHAAWCKAWRKVRPAFTRLKRDQEMQKVPACTGEQDADLQTLLGFLDIMQRYIRDAAARLVALDQAMNQDYLNLSMVTGEMQDGVRRARMLPFETILRGFHLTVRDLSRQHNKEIIFNVIGEQVELDKRVLEAIKDPIMHLLRNAVDHGLELPEERQAAGKDPAGYLTLMVAQKGAEILVTVGDDGRGIDPEQVKRAAVRSGRVGQADADMMDEREAVSMIFFPGLSTRDQVTTTSGRGIGMDVVRQNIEGLRGHVTVQSEPGRGTKVQLVVPVSLTTMYCMLARLGEETYALPVYSIERILEVMPEDTYTVKGRQVIKQGDRPLTLVNMADVLERPCPCPPHSKDRPTDEEETRLALILRAGDKMAAFLVDELLSEQELVVKNLGREMARVRNVAGVTLLGTGEVVVILNPSDLLKSAQAATRRYTPISGGPSEEAEARPLILVVDDSITTRTLEKNILESAGYQVITASDGQEALELVMQTSFDLIICDIEMPRMDGFALTRTIKSDENLKQIPLILVTSRDAPTDRNRGQEVGADAYIVKGEFDQGELLETIRQLL